MLKGRTVILVDDGLATGATMEAAVHALRQDDGRIDRRGGDPDQYQPLIEAIGDARVVLLGEATHGTHEFYRERAFITRRLIAECGLTAVAVEGDWPDAYRVNRDVRGVGSDEDSVESLGDFGRFPAWMWRNADVLDFIGWLRSYYDARPSNCAGFYGLDLYSLRSSRNR